MLIDFSIKNFASIRDKQTLSFLATNDKHLEDYYVIKNKKFRLLKASLIYGANASGKSNVLRALDFLRNMVLKPLERKTDIFDYEPFLFDPVTARGNSQLSVNFVKNNIRYYYEVEFNRHAVIEEKLYFFNPNKALVYSRQTDLDNKFSKIRFGSKIKIQQADRKALEANTLWNNTVLGGFLKTNIKLTVLEQVTSWFRKNLMPLVTSKTSLWGFVTDLLYDKTIDKELFLEILKRADFHISDVIIEKEPGELPDELVKILTGLIKDDEKLAELEKIEKVKIEIQHFVKGEKYSLPFALESDGTKRFYSFAGLLSLLISKDVIIPIDEIEASLHPELVEYFLLSFLVNAGSSQIIATSHYRELLKDKSLIRDDALWITDKDENDATVLYSFADFDSSVIRNTTSRYNAYVSGRLGGVPRLGDYFFTKNK